ncbi:MAG: ribulose-phosphate 3-epimerase [Candidatus Omnitrophota bacterium]|nr:ribulose-phosphate 3-epimerase [Candidatus Omnitrophota bacterium]MDZ4242029.1 ribulose-phosphate 3-epimerase [Candidatus Omnitrophota bacterium]
MPNPIKVSASILCSDFTNLGAEIRKCEQAGVDMIHVDVMDGQFVPNLTIGPLIVSAIRPLTRLPIEAHLMVEYPWRLMESFIDAGADIISLQAECYGERRAACRGLDQYPKEVDAINAAKVLGDVNKIRARGKKAFLVLNPGTPASCLAPVLGDIDGVLVMSVNPGFAKQKFMPAAVPKIQELRRGFKGDIAVDGGINAETAPAAVKAGASILATASYFFGAGDPQAAVKFLKGLK